MAEPDRKSGPSQVHVSFSFDRLFEPKLAQAYEILVPRRERSVGARVKEFEYENGGDLREGFVRATARENTIASQTASLIEFAQSHDLEVSKEWVFEDVRWLPSPKKRNWQAGTTASETRWGNALSREVHKISGAIGYVEGWRTTVA